MRKRWFSHIYSVINSTFLLQSIVWTFLDWNFQIKVFVDLVAVDFITSKNRFMVIYQFLSIIYHIRYFFFVWLHELHKIESISLFFPASAWYEREVWDMFGIVFVNHKDLRRILTDYGFVGFPLRKDFPLSGFGEVYYDSLVDSVLYRRAKLNQQFRIFKTVSPYAFYYAKKIC